VIDGWRWESVLVKPIHDHQPPRPAHSSQSPAPAGAASSPWLGTARFICWPSRYRYVPWEPYILIKMNGGRRPNQGRGAAKQHEPGRGKRPHLSRRGTIQITMINIIHIPTGLDGMRRGGNEIIMVHGEVPVGNRVAQYVIRIIRIMYYQYV